MRPSPKVYCARAFCGSTIDRPVKVLRGTDTRARTVVGPPLNAWPRSVLAADLRRGAVSVSRKHMRSLWFLAAALVLAAPLIQTAAQAAGEQSSTIASVHPRYSTTSASSPVSGGCPAGRNGLGWTLSTTTFDKHYTRHAYVGNGYLSQRVPATGMGYASTGEKTGWPLYTPRYDGAFVAGLYGADPAIEGGKTIDSAIPTWSTLGLTAGSETYSSATPAGEISNYSQTLYLGCGLLRTSLTWTTASGQATDLVYDVIADRTDPRVGAVHLTMVPHWNGPATVTDLDRRCRRAAAGADRRGCGCRFSGLDQGELRDPDAGNRRHRCIDPEPRQHGGGGQARRQRPSQAADREGCRHVLGQVRHVV